MNQKTMGAEFENSDRRFRIIFEDSPAIMLLIDLKSQRIIAANAAAEKYYGWEKSQIETMLISDINTLSHDEIKVEMEKARNGECNYFRFKHRLATGEVRNVEVYSGKVQIDGKDYLHSIIHDAAGQVKTEKALVQSQAYNRMLIEQSPVGLALTTIEGKLVDFNPAFAAIIGRTIEETERLTCWDITPEKYAKKEQEQLESLKKTGHYGPYEKEYIHKDGHLVPVRLQGSIFERDNEQFIWSSVEDFSKQTLVEEELRQSEERFKALHNASFGGIAIHHKGVLVDFNKGLSDLTGYTKEELTGMHVLNVIAKSHREFVSEKMLSGYEKHYEAICLHKTGKEFPVRIEARNVPYKGKTVRVAEFRDISEQKMAEEALSYSHKLMQYIIDHNQSAVAVHDKNLNYIFVSQRYMNDYQVKDKNIIGKHHYDVFPDIPEKWRKVHQKALRGIVSRADEDIFYREDGTFDWTRWECRPWHEADGSIGGMIVYTEVINEQKRKEEKIKELNLRLEILIESIQQLSSAKSLDSVQEIIGRSARKLIGADGATLVLREDDCCFYVNEDAIQPLWKGRRFPINSCLSGWVMQHKQTVVIEDVTLDERIPQDIYSPTFVKSLAMVPINTQEPIGVIGNYWGKIHMPTETEIQLLQTLADAAARALENIQLYDELEKRVIKRTEQLDAVNKELETFTYSVSHDLKAPLRGIDGYSKLLLDEYGDSLTDDATHFITTIRNSTLQMNQLIEDLLSYSRLERSPFKQEKIHLKSFIETLVLNFTEDLDTHGFKVALNVPDVEIVADTTGLSISLRNFIENAIKFAAGQKSPIIKIGFEEHPQVWIITVKDNGSGFDMKYHDRIFEIFQRLHRAEDFPGTGIGLAMVAKAVQRMKGKIWAESAPGKGASFFIEIPKNQSI